MKNKDSFIIVRTTSQLKEKLVREAKKRGVTLSKVVIEKLNGN